VACGAAVPGQHHGDAPDAGRRRALTISLSFNPNEAANQISAAKRLPATVQSWQFSAGTIGNTHFLAIPFNARAKAAAQVVADFLLSPLAQARKADIRHWGDPTVLALDTADAGQQAAFAAAAAPGHVRNRRPLARAAWQLGRPAGARMAARYGS
jgi:putative thiamine transport system substrate-binding protein